MIAKYKINPLEEILTKVRCVQREGKNVVLCHGHFNVIHPGHLRFLNHAKDQGDFLVVSILHHDDLGVDSKGDYFSQKERAEGVAHLQMVDAVYELPGSVVDFISELRPDIYMKGREFEEKRHFIQDEIDAIESSGGKMLFSSGDIEYSAKPLFNGGTAGKNSQKKDELLNICYKHSVNIRRLIRAIDDFSSLNMLVIGDTIVDQFIACDALGVSSEAPVLAVRELNSKEFIGGAAIVSQHIKSMGANCTYLSVIGDDNPGGLVLESLAEAGVHSSLITDDARPTTYKIRYMVENQKVLRVSRLKQHEVNSKIETQIISRLEELIPQMDGVVICDFVYGVITRKIRTAISQIARQHGVKVFGDLQCSSQTGDVSQYRDIELITPTEKEARIALGDYTSGLEALARNLLDCTQNRSIAITLAGQGFLSYSRDFEKDTYLSEYFPALEQHPVDVAGAGDSLLAAYALGLCKGLSYMEASTLGACFAGISVSRIGNIPLKPVEIKSYLNNINSYKDNCFSY